MKHRYDSSVIRKPCNNVCCLCCITNDNMNKVDTVYYSINILFNLPVTYDRFPYTFRTMKINDESSLI